MKGRVENSLIIGEEMERVLDNCPDYLKEYYDLFSISREPSSCKDTFYKIKRFLQFINQDMNKISFEDFNKRNVNKFFNSIKYKKNKNGEIVETSAAFINSTWYALNGFLKYLQSEGKITSNPMEGINKSRRKDNVKRITLSYDELSKMIKYTKENPTFSKCGNITPEAWSQRDALMLLLLAETGMRETALCEINVDDINLNEKKVKVIDKRHTVHEYPLSDNCINEILIWLKNRRLFSYGTDALFVTTRRSRVRAEYIRKMVKDRSFMALGKEITPHKIRASFCTNLYDITKDINFVRVAVGHTNIATTQRYINTDEEKIKREANKILSGIIL